LARAADLGDNADYRFDTMLVRSDERGYAAVMWRRTVLHEMGWLLALTTLIASFLPGTAWAFKKGDYVIADYAAGLWFVEADTHAQHELVSYYSGHGFADVATTSAGDIFALPSVGGSVVKIDPNTAGVSIIGSSYLLNYAASLGVAPGGQLYVLCNSPGSICQVDPGTGQVTTLVSGIVGDGFAVVSDSVAYVMLGEGINSWYLTKVRLDTGDTTRVTNTPFGAPGRLVLDNNGHLLLTLPTARQVWWVDPGTGGAAVISSDPVYMTPLGVAPVDVSTLVVADNQNLASCTRPQDHQCPGALYSVARGSGVATLITEKGLFQDIVAVAIYQGPTTVSTTRATWGRVKTLYR
jgi:hypothetical protein